MAGGGQQRKGTRRPLACGEEGDDAEWWGHTERQLQEETTHVGGSRWMMVETGGGSMANDKRQHRLEQRWRPRWRWGKYLRLNAALAEGIRMTLGCTVPSVSITVAVESEQYRQGRTATGAIGVCHAWKMSNTTFMYSKFYQTW
jgi:hypothetical protein